MKKAKKTKNKEVNWVRSFMTMVRGLDIGMSSTNEEKPLPDVDFEAPLRSYRRKHRKGKH